MPLPELGRAQSNSPCTQQVASIGLALYLVQRIEKGKTLLLTGSGNLETDLSCNVALPLSKIALL